MGLKTAKYVDNTTKEVSYETHEFYIKSEPNFFKAYIDDLGALFKLSKTASDVLFEVCKRMNYENKIILIKSEKEEIAVSINKTLHSVEKAIKELYKEDFLLKFANQRSKYVVNPKFFAKGVWKDIYKLRLSIMYENNQRYIVTEYEKNETTHSN